jgi:hypothetical protein
MQMIARNKFDHGDGVDRAMKRRQQRRTRSVVSKEKIPASSSCGERPAIDAAMTTML